MRQKWGQNFLTDQNIAAKIVGALGGLDGRRVLEIGPGKGVLTRHLVGKADVTAVELDKALAGELAGRWGTAAGFQLVNADFLNWPLPDWPKGAGLVVSNLPYSAGAAILQKLLDWPGWGKAVVMLQKEVAARILAKPDTTDYGILTLAVQGKAAVQKLFDVAPGAFRPPPKVVSTVLSLAPHPRPLIQNESQFFRVVHAAFSQRRKTLANTLSHGLDLPKPEVEARLNRLAIDPSRRAETLTLHDYNRLADAFPG